MRKHAETLGRGLRNYNGLAVSLLVGASGPSCDVSSAQNRRHASYRGGRTDSPARTSTPLRAHERAALPYHALRIADGKDLRGVREVRHYPLVVLAVAVAGKRQFARAEFRDAVRRYGDVAIAEDPLSHKSQIFNNNSAHGRLPVQVFSRIHPSISVCIQSRPAVLHPV